MSELNELVKQAANGDRAAFDRLYEQTKSGVWFTCIGILNNEENAKDIMQETYLTAFERLGTLEKPESVQSWLNKTAANKCRNHLNAKSNSALEENSEEILDNIPDDGLVPEEYVEDKAKRELIMRLIREALSEEQYQTVILYYFDELTAPEIAELMGVHEKTVRYRLKIAREKIKEAVSRYEDENREKLHAVVPLIPLSRLLGKASQNAAPPEVPLQIPTSTPTSSPNTAVSAAKTGGKAMLNTLKAKIIAGACAVAVVGGGVTAGVVIANNSKNKPENRPAVNAPANVSKPAEQSTPATSDADNAASETSLAVTSNGKMVEGDFEFEIYEKDNKTDPNYVQVTKFLGSGSDITIPSTLGGKPVKAISSWLTASNRDDIVSITMPDTVTEINLYAFRDFNSLTEVNFSKNLEILGYGAFSDCESLESVVLPEGLKEICAAAFWRCGSLKSVTVPDSVEIIDNTAFCYVSEDCELHFRGYTFKGADLDGLKLYKGELYLSDKVIPIGDLDKVLG